MVKKIYLLFSFWLIALSTQSQDIITRSDGVIIRAQVLETKTNLISFKLFDQADTLTYQISTQDVQSLRLADGTTQTFNPPGEKTGKNSVGFNYETQTRRHIIWFTPSDLIYANFTFAYEQLLPSGKVGIKVPVTLGFSGNSGRNYFDDFRRNNRYGAGLELNFYVFGQGRLSYYLGPALHFRTYRLYYYNSQPQPELLEENAQFFTAAFKNGIYYQLNKNISISADVGLGMRFFKEPDAPNEFYYPINRNRGFVPGNVHLGFRF